MLELSFAFTHIYSSFWEHRRNGVEISASASLSVHLEFIYLVELYHNSFKNGIHDDLCDLVLTAMIEKSAKVVQRAENGLSK